MKHKIYIFLVGMWLLILASGGIAVLVLGPISITGFGEYDQVITSLAKASIALGMIVAWIVILTKLKNWMFRKEIQRK